MKHNIFCFTGHENKNHNNSHYYFIEECDFIIDDISSETEKPFYHILLRNIDSIQLIKRSKKFISKNMRENGVGDHCVLIGFKKHYNYFYNFEIRSAKFVLLLFKNIEEANSFFRKLKFETNGFLSKLEFETND